MVSYIDQNKTYTEAKKHCMSYDSQLLEIWDLDEWKEVKFNFIGSNPLK